MCLALDANSRLCLSAQGTMSQPASGGDPSSLSLQHLGTKVPAAPNKLKLQAKEAVLSQRQKEPRTDGKATFSTHYFFFFYLFPSSIALRKGDRLEWGPWLRTNSGVCELSLFLPRFESSLLAGPILCPICIHSQPIRAHETLYKKMQHKHFFSFTNTRQVLSQPSAPGSGQRFISQIFLGKEEECVWDLPDSEAPLETSTSRYLWQSPAAPAWRVTVPALGLWDLPASAATWP